MVLHKFEAVAVAGDGGTTQAFLQFAKSGGECLKFLGGGRIDDASFSRAFALCSFLRQPAIIPRLSEWWAEISLSKSTQALLKGGEDGCLRRGVLSRAAHGLGWNLLLPGSLRRFHL
jgi:hypothetical protein